MITRRLRFRFLPELFEYCDEDELEADAAVLQTVVATKVAACL